MLYQQQTTHLKWGLTHRGPVTHMCVSKLSLIASDNGLSPSQCQAIIWTSAGIIGPLVTNFSEILIGIFHSRKCIWKCRLWNGGYFVWASMCSYSSWLVWSINHRKQLIAWIDFNPTWKYSSHYINKGLNTCSAEIKWTIYFYDLQLGNI